MRRIHISLLLLFLTSTYTYSYTIEEKQIDLIHNNQNENINYEEKNLQIKNLYKKLEEEYSISASLIASSAEDKNFQSLTQRIQLIRDEISDVENAWKDSQTEDFNKNDNQSSLWEHGEITISKLIIEYGSCESLYAIPPEIANQKLSLHCLLSIPKESWPKMIELILIHNNIGIKKINPFLKQLYLLKEDYTNIEMVTSDIRHLEVLDNSNRIIFIYTPPIENIKTSYYFLDRFKNAKTTYLYQVGSKIAIVGLIKDISKLISLAENVWDKNEQRISKIISPQKISPFDAVKLLKSYFGGLTDYTKPLISMKGGNGLSAFTLNGENSLVLIGSNEIVAQAENILRQTESQVHDPSEIILYWHTCSHCNPTELAEILAKVYHSLNACNIDGFKKTSETKTVSPFLSPSSNRISHSISSADPAIQSDPNSSLRNCENFFPYPETGSLLMTIRKDSLNQIKEIIKKIDKPKKMVEIEVLLCERRIKNSSKSGINLLKLADAASNANSNSFTYDASTSNVGIMEFIFNRKEDKKRKIPAIDLSYNFLLCQEDVMVTASPSTTTLNQLPTTLAITDQISIHTGTTDTNADSYERADYGITITLTPTIHEQELDSSCDSLFITLENDIKFESITSNVDAHPSVHTKHIKSTVRIPDGQTIIIGGLRSTITKEDTQKIPFLGEIPGFAKIFGSNVSSNVNNEMFIFIKPTIISDPSTDLLRLRDDRLRKRPGDTEMLLKKINESKENEQQIRFQKSFNLLFGSGKINEQTL